MTATPQTPAADAGTSAPTPHVFHPLALERTFLACLLLWRETNPGTLLDDAAMAAAAAMDEIGEADLAVIVEAAETDAENKLLPAARAWQGEVEVRLEAVRGVTLDAAQAAAELLARAIAESDASGTLAETWEDFAPEEIFFAAPAKQTLAVSDGTRLLSTVYTVKLRPAEVKG